MSFVYVKIPNSIRLMSLDFFFSNISFSKFLFLFKVGKEWVGEYSLNVFFLKMFISWVLRGFVFLISYKDMVQLLFYCLFSFSLLMRDDSSYYYCSEFRSYFFYFTLIFILEFFSSVFFLNSNVLSFYTLSITIFLFWNLGVQLELYLIFIG